MKDFFKLKTWLITVLMLIAAVGISSAIVYFEFAFNRNIKPTQASSANNVSGFAWSANAGWISFNCTNDSPACANSNYGVSIDPASGDFSGHAWSSNVGWISFNRADTGDSPDQPYKNGSILANYDAASGEVSGWAKILAMGDDGWIKLRKFFSDSGSDYGVIINPDSNEFSGWAWNANNDGSGIGWISFNCANENPACGDSDYKVTAEINHPPAAADPTAPNWSFADAAEVGALNAILSWTFNDDDPGAFESAYQIIVNTVDNTANPLFDSGKCTGYNTPTSDCKVAPGAGQFPLASAMTLGYDVPYYWWVKVWDNAGAASVLKQYNSPQDTPLEADDGLDKTFTTYKHEMPDVDFNWFPLEPSKGEEVKFTDDSWVYSSDEPDANPDKCVASLCSWAWSVTGAEASIDDPATSTPTMIFNSTGNAIVSLTVTDDDGYYTSKSHELNINTKLPKWKEVKPE